MSGISYLADTNAFIYLLEGQDLVLQLAQFDWAFLYITEIELLSKRGITAQEETSPLSLPFPPSSSFLTDDF